MKEFQKYTGSTKFYCTDSGISSGLLTTGMVSIDINSDSKLIYFGLTNGTNFKNNLKGINDKPIQLTCDQPDCDASVYHYWDQPDNDTGMNINLHIPKSYKNRTIIFSYNGTPLFTILQQKKST